jgi:hypothetical protein
MRLQPSKVWYDSYLLGHLFILHEEEIELNVKKSHLKLLGSLNQIFKTCQIIIIIWQ